MDCVFCKIADKEIPANIIYEDNDIIAFNDLDPQAPEHILIIPRTHIATTNDIEEDQAELIGRMVLTAKKIAKGLDIDQSGYRIVLNCQAGAGQSVFHIHLHVLGGRQMAWPPG